MNLPPLTGAEGHTPSDLTRDQQQQRLLEEQVFSAMLSIQAAIEYHVYDMVGMAVTGTGKIVVDLVRHDEEGKPITARSAEVSHIMAVIEAGAKAHQQLVLLNQSSNGKLTPYIERCEEIARIRAEKPKPKLIIPGRN